MIAKNAALFLGILFIVFGVLGFVDNPVIGSDGAIHTGRTHDIVHLVTGIVFLGVTLLQNEIIRIVILVFGFVYLLLGLIGLLQIGASGNGSVLGLTVNGNTNLFHIGLGVVVLILGITARRDVQRSTFKV